LPSSANGIRRMLTVLYPPVTGSTPVVGHVGATTTKSVDDKATASNNNSKITKCGWSSARRPPAANPDHARLMVPGWWPRGTGSGEPAYRGSGP
jgi:hypothetical protein